MTDRYLNKRAEMEFRHRASMKLTPLSYCKTVDQLRATMEDIHFIIVEMKEKYGGVPDTASLMFARYMSKHDKMVYENFLKEYTD